MIVTPSNKIKITLPTENEKKDIYMIRHAIYAEELHQHPTNDQEILQDDLDHSNHYVIALLNNQVIGFISITSSSAGRYSADKYFDRAGIPLPFDEYLYELRILSVIKGYRNGPLAYLLMYAGMRWIEAHGGKNIIAICRSEIIEMYHKVGLKTTGIKAKSGAVSYELSYATIDGLNDWLKNKFDLFKYLSDKIEWCLPFSFFAPSTCYHGGSSFKAIGEDLQTLRNREVVINADVLDAWFPPSPKVTELLQNNLEWLLSTSPPTHCDGLIRSIAETRGIPQASVLPGAGSSDLIFLALPFFLTAASKVLVIDPCYGEYRHVLDKVIQCSVTTFTLRKDEGFVIDTNLLLKEINKGFDMVVIVNPNNPTGVCIEKDKMKDLLRKIPSGTLIWIDETYMDYHEKSESLEQFASGTENVLICKSMSKGYALSGARIGYLCSAPHLLETLKLLTPPWAVSLPGQLAAITALADEKYYSIKYAETRALREEMKLTLTGLGMENLIEGVANFILFYLPANVSSVTDFLDRCKKQNLYIRDVSNMGSALESGALRIAIKDKKTNDRIKLILGQVLTEIKNARQ